LNQIALGKYVGSNQNLPLSGSRRPRQPEPATLVLLATGLAGLHWRRRTAAR
jgi:hypothetical protein